MWDSMIGRKYLADAWIETEQGLNPVMDLYSNTSDGLSRWKKWNPESFDPNLTWKRLYAEDFGFPENQGGYGFFYNGEAYICQHYFDDNMVYDFNRKFWVAANPNLTTGGWNVEFAGNGLFILGYFYSQSILISQDGVHWTRSFAPSSNNGLRAAASDGKYGLAAFFWNKTPLFYTKNILNKKTFGWDLVGTNENLPSDVEPFPDFTYMEFYNGYYVGCAVDRKYLYISRDGFKWTKSIFVEPTADGVNRYISSLKKIHDKLFLATYIYGQYSKYDILLVSPDLTNTKVVLEGISGSIQSGIYIRRCNTYLIFGNNCIWYSSGGETWKTQAQNNFSGGKGEAVYIPGDGIYVPFRGGYYDTEFVYYASYS